MSEIKQNAPLMIRARNLTPGLPVHLCKLPSLRTGANEAQAVSMPRVAGHVQVANQGITMPHTPRTMVQHIGGIQRSTDRYDLR